MTIRKINKRVARASVCVCVYGCLRMFVHPSLCIYVYLVLLYVPACFFVAVPSGVNLVLNLGVVDPG